MDKLKDMQLLAAVVQKGSFAQAARTVGLTPAMVGRRIAALEQQLGFRLFNRSTRKMVLTPGGESYYQGSLQILEQVSALEESLAASYQQEPRGLVRLSAPDGLGSPFLIKAISEFRRRYPKVRFDVDLTSAPLDLVREKIDLSLRLAFELEDSDLVASPLSQTDFGLYAAPKYLAERGQPASLAELSSHDCLHMGQSKYADNWTILRAGEPVSFRQEWALTLPNSECLMQALAEGMGIAMVPKIFARPFVERGQITPIEGLAEFPRLTIYALYPSRKHLPYRVQLFLDFLKHWGPDRLAAS